MQAALLEAALSLPPEERRELIDRLAESLGDDEFVLSPAQEAELDRRLDRLDQTGPTGRPWREVMAEIRKKHLS